MPTDRGAKKQKKASISSEGEEKAAPKRVVLRPDVDVYSERLLIPTALIAHAFDVTMDAVIKWGVRPVVKQHREALLYLPEIIANRMGFGEDGAPKLNPAQEKALLDKSRRESVQLDLEEKRGNLLRLDMIEKEWQRQMIVTRQRLLSLPSRLARQIVLVKTPAEVQQLLNDEIENALGELSNDYSRISGASSPSAPEAAAETDPS